MWLPGGGRILNNLRSSSILRSQWLEIAHALLGAAGLWVVAAALMQQNVDIAPLLLCVAALLAAVLAPRWPLLGIVAFLAVSGGLPRYSSQSVAVIQTGVLNWLGALALTGWAVWLVRQGRHPALTRPTIIVLLLFLAWGVLSFVLSPFRDASIELGSRHHPVQYFLGAALMVVASDLLRLSRLAQWVAAIVCALPLVRGLLQIDTGLHLETDVPALAAVALPISLVAAGSRVTPSSMRVAAGAAAAALVYILLQAQNRGALVGVLLALLALWSTARLRVRNLLWVLPLVAAAALLAPGAYVDRFRVLWDPQARHATAGLDLATVDERLELWRAAHEMLQDRPLLGVGPGLGPAALSQYLPSKAGTVIHNSALGVAAEFGLIGFALWVLLYGAALLHLYLLARRLPDGWPRDSARMVHAAIAAYLGAGMFISRQDEPLAYLLLGWALAMALNAASSSPGAHAGTIGLTSEVVDARHR